MVIYDMIWYSVAQSRIKYYSAIANVQIMRDRETERARKIQIEPEREREPESEPEAESQ